MSDTTQQRSMLRRARLAIDSLPDSPVLVDGRRLATARKLGVPTQTERAIQRLDVQIAREQFFDRVCREPHAAYVSFN